MKETEHPHRPWHHRRPARSMPTASADVMAAMRRELEAIVDRRASEEIDPTATTGMSPTSPAPQRTPTRPAGGRGRSGALGRLGRRHG